MSKVDRSLDGDLARGTTQRPSKAIRIARQRLRATTPLDEAEVEHASAKELIAQIKDIDANEDLYDAKVTVLGEYINHHVKEEEGEMFPKAKKSDMDLKALGAEQQARKSGLTEFSENAIK